MLIIKTIVIIRIICIITKFSTIHIFFNIYFNAIYFMKLMPFLFIYLCFFLNLTPAKAQAQSFNKWSIEANAGFGKPISPFAPNYFSSNKNTYFAFFV